MKQLMADLGRVPPGTVKFVERKYFKLLDSPLEYSGFLIYTPPNRLEKRTVFPKTETLVVDDSKLTLETPRQRRVLSLQEHPEVGAFVESIRATLKGDLAALNRFYRVSLAGSAQAWQLSLVPNEEKMRLLIRAIEISGSQNSVNTIEIREADGDRSVMTVTSVVRHN